MSGRRPACFLAPRAGVYYSLEPGEEELLLPSLQAGYIQHREQEARRIVFCRQASTATTGTEKSEATLHTTLSTIPEEHGGRKKQDRSREGERARQWMFEGKLQGSVLFRQYYPEGGWGCVVIAVGAVMMALTQGIHMSFGMLVKPALWRFRPSLVSFVTLSSFSISVSRLIAPLVISVCKHRSARLTAVVGGLILSLGCLFTSFATHFHQLYISYGLFMGVGISMAQNSFLFMVGQYFKKKREKVEIIIESSTGLGLVVMSGFLNNMTRTLGWRIGLQVVTGILVSIFFIGMSYRSASLYHPQRRAILHLKNQKRKIKCKKEDKKKIQEEQPPHIDTVVLKSKTVRLLLLSSSLSSPGLLAPLIFLSTEAGMSKIPPLQIVQLHMFLGVGWILGCLVFGFLVIRKTTECNIARQYLCQTSLTLCGLANLCLTYVTDYDTYVVFCWIYGFCLGAHFYSLKMYIFEKVRSKSFPWAWGFLQLAQSLPLVGGVFICGLVRQTYGPRSQYYICAVLVLLGSLTMTRIETGKRRKRRQRQKQKAQEINAAKEDGTKYEDEEGEEEEEEELQDVDDDFLPPLTLHTQQRSVTYGDLVDGQRPNLPCISEEALEDINFPEKFLEELECLENITSCNKVENYLLFSEFEQNFGNVLSPRRRDGEVQERVPRAQTGRDRLNSSWHVPLPKRRVSTIVENSV